MQLKDMLRPEQRTLMETLRDTARSHNGPAPRQPRQAKSNWRSRPVDLSPEKPTPKIQFQSRSATPNSQPKGNPTKPLKASNHQ